MGMEDARPWTFVLRSKNDNQRAKNNSRNAYIRSHGEQSCASPWRPKFCFRTNPDSDQAYKASPELEYLEFQREMICCTIASCWP